MRYRKVIDSKNGEEANSVQRVEDGAFLSKDSLEFQAWIAIAGNELEDA